MQTPTDVGGRCGLPDLAIDPQNATPIPALQAYRRRLSDRRHHEVFGFEYEGFPHLCTVSRFDDGRLGEIFLTTSKAGSAAQANADTAAILASLLLQYGVPAATIAKAVRGSAVAMAIELARAPA